MNVFRIMTTVYQSLVQGFMLTAVQPTSVVVPLKSIGVPLQETNRDKGAVAQQHDAVESDLRNAIEGVSQAVAQQSVARDWGTFLDSIVADLDDLQAAGSSAERQRESVRRLGKAVARLRKTLTLPGVSSIADDVAVLTSRLERRIAVLSLALPLI